MESIFCHVDKDSHEKNEWAPYGKDADYTTGRGKLMKLWANFYGLSHFPSYAELKQSGSDQFITLSYGYGFFNTKVYKVVARLFLCVFSRLTRKE